MSEESLPDHAFQPTRWTLVVNSKGEGREAEQALGDLCSTYWFPLYAFARRAGWKAEDAEDVVQGFFAQIVEKDVFDRADPSKGRLRTFLLTAFRRHGKDEMQKINATKRGGKVEKISFDASEAESWYSSEVTEGETADAMFDRQWALTVLDKAIAQMEEHARSRNKLAEFQLMRPFLLEDSAGEDFQRIGAELQITENAAKIQIFRLRSRFRETLRAEVRETQLEGDDEEEELLYLLSQLGPM
jgi:RNA polymerase sigma factor (sigma-70 family)